VCALRLSRVSKVTSLPCEVVVETPGGPKPLENTVDGTRHPIPSAKKTCLYILLFTEHVFVRTCSILEAAKMMLGFSHEHPAFNPLLSSLVTSKHHTKDPGQVRSESNTRSESS
jgi:hypothetical protein